MNNYFSKRKPNKRRMKKALAKIKGKIGGKLTGYEKQLAKRLGA
jgi:hypothetical protein